MGKTKTLTIGDASEDAIKAKKAVKREQKKLREGKEVKKTSPQPEETIVETPKEISQEPQVESPEAPEQKPKKIFPKSAKKRSANYLKAKSQVPQEPISKDQALTLLRQVSYSSFQGTVELHIVLKKRPESKVTVSLPHATGAKSKVVVVVNDEILKKIESNNIDFDVLVASPSDMAKLVKYAKVLGPKGLMPNPKSGTVSEKPEEAAKKLQSDTSIELKLEKSAPVIHTTVGKLSQKDNELSENIGAIVNTLTRFGFVKIVLKSTMSPAIKLSF